MKPGITFGSFCLQLIAGAVVWNLTLAICAVLGSLVHIRFWPEVVIWLWLGLVVVRFKNVRTLTPVDHRVDLLAMGDLLWKAARWPKYFLKT